MKMDKSHCKGCRENFYNGENPYGVTECWHLKTAKLILRKAVPLDQRPPWNQRAELYPSCYRKPRHVMVKPDVTQ